MGTVLIDARPEEGKVWGINKENIKNGLKGT
jgi:hypothetical protein